jgi:hypothetical protein
MTIQGVPFNESEGTITMWAVAGQRGVFFCNKMEAEAFARMMFPDESPERRYARIWFETFRSDNNDL